MDIMDAQHIFEKIVKERRIFTIDCIRKKIKRGEIESVVKEYIRKFTKNRRVKKNNC